MAEHWQPTVAGYFGQVTKSGILAAVREAKGEASAQLIEHLKKADMAREAERLMKTTRWLPAALRTPGIEDHQMAEAAPEPDVDSAHVVLPAFLTGDVNTEGDLDDRSANDAGA